MFRGRYPHTIDPKGRLSIPAKFREELAARDTNTLVLTEGDHCIVAYPLDEWERFEEKLRQQPQLAPEMRNFLRVAVASAKDCPVDKAGRTLVPPELREFSGLSKDVMIVGVLNKFEIWNRERWNDHYQRARGSFDENARKLSEFGL
ncbi:MAG: division/cell wall cluster transcriptional repressor MraZ [Candidatus Rokubacteria bacterium]|nr:division/cell wall cluster transcriptional repressor MraZ [Candidatus Rokubacteria bacterium]